MISFLPIPSRTVVNLCRLSSPPTGEPGQRFCGAAQGDEGSVIELMFEPSLAPCVSVTGVLGKLGGSPSVQAEKGPLPYQASRPLPFMQVGREGPPLI